MSQEVRGVVSRRKGAPVEVTTIVVPDPGPGEAVVRVQSCGVCHTKVAFTAMFTCERCHSEPQPGQQRWW